VAKKERAPVTEEAREQLALEYARRVRGLYSDASQRFEDERYSDVVCAVQEALELWVKALFLAKGLAAPKTHRLHHASLQDELAQLGARLRQKLTEEQWDRLDLPRALFLAGFWGEFYTVAKYGSDVIGVGPTHLFRRGEAQLALSHLEEVVEGFVRLFAPEEQA
jgi:HEPN domain-containing protein